MHSHTRLPILFFNLKYDVGNNFHFIVKFSSFFFYLSIFSTQSSLAAQLLVSNHILYRIQINMLLLCFISLTHTLSHMQFAIQSNPRILITFPITLTRNTFTRSTLIEFIHSFAFVFAIIARSFVFDFLFLLFALLLYTTTTPHSLIISLYFGHSNSPRFTRILIFIHVLILVAIGCSNSNR